MLVIFNVEHFLKEKAVLIDKTITKYIPRAFTETSTLFMLVPPQYAQNLEALNKGLAEPIWDFLDRGGKRWRPALFLLILEVLGRYPEEYADFAIIPEIIHNGTLMVDDVEDSSELRRGKACTYKIYGKDIAINTGNSMYYLPLLPFIEKRDIVPRKRLVRLYEIYVEEMIKLSLGQAMDIAWHRGMADADNIGEKDYLQMCAYKTGTLARMSAKMAAVLGNADAKLVEELGNFAESIGIAFQMQDDILDLTSSKFIEKKGGRGQDITEGKRSMIIIHTLKAASDADKRRLIEILNMHTLDQRLKDEAIAILYKYGSVEYVKDFARNIVMESWNRVEQLLPQSETREKLKVFGMFLVERNI